MTGPETIWFGTTFGVVRADKDGLALVDMDQEIERDLTQDEVKQFYKEFPALNEANDRP